MFKRLGMLCAVLATGAGCVVPCHKGYEKTLHNGPECQLPPAARNRVHVFLMHGLTPSTAYGLDALRLKLAEHGYAKVGAGELCHAGWVRDEVTCIRQHDPDARFVLVGYDLGAPVAASLARELVGKGVPVDALVLLDPVGCPPEPSGVYTLLIANPKWATTTPHSTRVVVPDATHLTLPAHSTTVGVIADVLKDIAVRNVRPEIDEPPVWSYPHAPEVRPAPTAPPGGDWDFLADRPGPTRAMGAQVATHPAARPPATAANPNGPVAAKR